MDRSEIQIYKSLFHGKRKYLETYHNNIRYGKSDCENENEQ